MPETKTHDLEEQIRRMTPVSAPDDQRENVMALYRLLVRAVRAEEGDAPRLRLVGPEGESIPLPETALYLLERVAEVLGHGDAIAVIPVGKELTTQQAADILNVSRQYLVRLLDEGKIPCTRTGKHRRVFVEDVLAFKKERDGHRRAALDRLTRLSEELGGYAEIK